MPILTAEERLGTVVDGKYRLDRILGRGGMGVVYAAHHLRLDRPVAVKFLHASLTESKPTVERFIREAQAASRLEHPNVVAVRDVDVAEDGGVFMVLELLEGEALASYLSRRGSLSASEVVTILAPAIDGLAAAHDAGIIHRDIKPENLFLSRSADGRIVTKVLDFGVAKLIGAGAQSTMSGSVVGTPVYMAPEQTTGKAKELGPWTDCWSIGVLLYECLTAKYPFDFEPDAAPTTVMMAIVSTPPIPLRERRSELPEPLLRLVDRALQRDPAKRFRHAREMADELRAMLASGDVQTVPIEIVGGRTGTPLSTEVVERLGPLRRAHSTLVRTAGYAAAVLVVASAALALALTLSARQSATDEMVATPLGSGSPTSAPDATDGPREDTRSLEVAPPVEPEPAVPPIAPPRDVVRDHGRHRPRVTTPPQTTPEHRASGLDPDEF